MFRSLLKLPTWVCSEIKGTKGSTPSRSIPITRDPFLPWSPQMLGTSRMICSSIKHSAVEIFAGQRTATGRVLERACCSHVNPTQVPTGNLRQNLTFWSHHSSSFALSFLEMLQVSQAQQHPAWGRDLGRADCSLVLWGGSWWYL